MTKAPRTEIADEMPQLQGHMIGFADSLSICEAMTFALKREGFLGASIVVLHGREGIQLLEESLSGSSWGESAETILKQGTIEMENGHYVVCIEAETSEEAETVAAISTRCGVRSIYHFGLFVDTRLTL